MNRNEERIRRILMLPALCFVFLFGVANQAAAQTDPSGNHRHAAGTRPAGPATTADEARPAIIDGVQVIEIDVTGAGYAPKRIVLEAGVPARLVFTRSAKGGCVEQVQIPEFGIGKTSLPLGEPVAIEFTPSKAGTFTFACGMNMMKGTLLVRS